MAADWPPRTAGFTSPTATASSPRSIRGSGKVIWQKNLGATVRAAPTAAGDKLYVVTMQGNFYCLNGADGAELWVARGLPQPASLTISTSPAVDGDIVVVPYPSGDVMALKVADGQPVWTENLARARQTSQIASMNDAARPAIDGGTVFAVGHAGRMIATQSHTGERLWSLNVPGIPGAVGGGRYGLRRRYRRPADGSRARRRKDALDDASCRQRRRGPALCSPAGTLWLASNKGQVIGVDAATGTVGRQADLGDPVYISPVVAQGRMFVLTDTAKLIALN